MPQLVLNMLRGSESRERVVVRVIVNAITNVRSKVEVTHVNVKKCRGKILGEMAYLLLASKRVVVTGVRVHIIEHGESLVRDTIREKHAFVRRS